MQQVNSAISAGTWPAIGTKLYSWGSNSAGRLGLGNTTNYSSPKQVGLLTTWTNVMASGAGAAFAIKSDGTLWAWGSASSGQLGLGNSTISYSSPVQVGSLTSWSSISSGYVHVLALKTNGTLWAWGWGSSGSLGLGNLTSYSSPVQVGSLTNWLQVSAGYQCSAAIKTDGTLWSWGRNNVGQLGLNSLSYKSSPNQIGALTNWAKVSMGFAHCIATQTNGTLWAWGQNNLGSLGLNNSTYAYSSPVQIGALTTWSKPTAGLYDSFGITTSGALWSWGRNDIGQLGLGNITYSFSSPQQVGSLTNWRDAYTGSYAKSILSIKTDGTLWTWGANAGGTLGLGNTTYYSSPKQVGSLTNWTVAFTNGLNGGSFATFTGF
jgi:hypothetical protein